MARGNLLSLIATCLIYFFGQATARSFYEILLWIVVGIALCKHSNILNIKISNLFLNFQSITVTVMALFGIWALTPGIFSAKFRERVLIRSAHEYEAIKWMNYLIPPKSRVLSELRSVALLSMISCQQIDKK